MERAPQGRQNLIHYRRGTAAASLVRHAPGLERGETMSLIARYSPYRWPALLAVAPLAASLSLAATQPARTAAAAPLKIGAPMGALSFCDVAGKPYSLADLRGQKAVLFIFLSTECPVSNGYGPRLQDLDKEYAGRGVALFGVNSNWQESLTAVIRQAKARGFPF